MNESPARQTATRADEATAAATEVEDEGTPIRCDRCDAVEYILGEISEETLEGAGWYLGPCSTLCDECNEDEEDDEV